MKYNQSWESGKIYIWKMKCNWLAQIFAIMHPRNVSFSLWNKVLKILETDSSHTFRIILRYVLHISKASIVFGLVNFQEYQALLLAMWRTFFFNKRHKHFLTFNVWHIFPLRVSFSSFITKCLAKIVQIHNVSGTGSDFTLPDFRSSWDALDAVLSPHSLRCVAYSPQLLISILSPPVSKYSNKPIQDHL